MNVQKTHDQLKRLVKEAKTDEEFVFYKEQLEEFVKKHLHPNLYRHEIQAP
jgi:hypothetical protein